MFNLKILYFFAFAGIEFLGGKNYLKFQLIFSRFTESGSDIEQLIFFFGFLLVRLL